MSIQQKHSTVPASEAEPLVNNSVPTDQNRCLSEGYDNTSHRTLNTTTRNEQSNNEDIENISETSSAERRIPEKMRDFENEIETKMQLERTQF